MRIHENELVEQTAIETIASLQMGLEMNVLEAVKLAYEEQEAYEECLGINLGIEYYKTKNFGCKVKSPYED